MGSAAADLDRVSPGRRPEGRPLALQRWSRLLFVHWRVPTALLAPKLPPGLSLDTWEGDAWLSLVPFTMTRTRPWWGPSVPILSDSHEVNLRTYVHRAGADPGVWFFSLDAAHPLATPFARLLYKLPYHFARMSLEGDAETVFASRRIWRGPEAACRVSYRAHGPESSAEPGTLDHFLVERYILYAAAGGRLYQARVHHRPYPVRAATCDGLVDSLSTACGLPPAVPERLHAVDTIDVEIFPLRRLS